MNADNRPPVDRESRGARVEDVHEFALSMSACADHWVPGIATVLRDDDPLARQRRIIRWHPLRALNAVNVRVLGADLLTVHVRLLLDNSSGSTAATEHLPDALIKCATLSAT